MAEDTVDIVYDTDLGEDIDDLYALYLALFHPRIRARAVTTVHGDTQAKARLAAKVLRLAGFPDVPVGAGIGMSEDRTTRGQTRPDPDHSASYVCYTTEDDPEWGRTYPTAAEVIESVLREATEPVALVGEGAFSNLAAAVTTSDDDLRANIGCIAVMGGETRRLHNEYNVVCDPEAADGVFTCGLPVFMGTFDLTAQLRMTMAEVEEAFGGSDSAVHRVMCDCTQLWYRKAHSYKAGPVLYDLVPVFWLADQSCVTTCRSTIRVELEGQYTRGQTVRMPGEGGPVLESLDLDAAAMIREFVDIMREA